MLPACAEIWLGLSFLSSFLGYVVGREALFQWIAIAMLNCQGALFAVPKLWKIAKDRGQVQIPRPVGVIVVISVTTLPASLLGIGAGWFAMAYWATVAVTLTSSLLIVSKIGIQSMMRALGISALGVMASLVMFRWDDFLVAIRDWTNPDFGQFHYNLVAFVVGGGIGPLVWLYFSGYKTMSALGMAASVGIVFLTSSRGALVSIAVGMLVVLLSSGVCTGNKKGWDAITRQVLMRLLGILATVGILVGVAAFIPDVWNAVSLYLLLDSPYRGVDSGLSGRIDNWALAQRDLYGGAWLTGTGFRAGNLLSYPIDNGYLVVLYELGVAPLIVIVYCYVTTWLRSLRAVYVMPSLRAAAPYLGILFIVTFVAISSIVARFLFGLGNPISLICLMLLLAPRRSYLCVQDGQSRNGVGGTRVNADRVAVHFLQRS